MKIASVLIRNEPAREVPREEAARGFTPLRIIVASLAVLTLALHVHSLVERLAIFPAALKRQDLESAAASLERQNWLGNTNALKHLIVARRFDRGGQAERAIEQYELSAGMEPHVATLRRLVLLYSRKADATGFVRACDRLFDLDGIERPMPTPDVDRANFEMPAAFANACLKTAQTAVLSGGSRRGGNGTPATDPVDALERATPNAYQ